MGQSGHRIYNNAILGCASGIHLYDDDVGGLPGGVTDSVVACNYVRTEGPAVKVKAREGLPSIVVANRVSSPVVTFGEGYVIQAGNTAIG